MTPPFLYDKLIHVILDQNQFVIAIFSNVFVPQIDNHRFRASKIPKIFDNFILDHPQLPGNYSLVGHSAGGKIVLLVAAVYDVNRLNTVIALDPVDQNPHEFTNNGTDISNESLTQSKATIVLTQTGIYDEPNTDRFDPKHNAASIHEFNPNTLYIYHNNSGHNAYTDLQIPIDFIVPSGNPDANSYAKQDAFNLIRQYIG